MSRNSNIHQENRLDEVVIIRLILIVLLVLYHSFAIYSGGWEPIEGFPEIKAYWWLGKFSYAFFLETFVFISGYILGYQVRTKGKEKISAKNIFVGKIKRLIIPSVVFSFLYLLLIQDYEEQSIISTLYSILEGAGHMWFLPMLFWCFCGVWFIERIRISPAIVFPVLLLFSIGPHLPLPFRLGDTLYYLLYFYTGYYVQKNSIDLSILSKHYTLIILSFLFLTLFPVLTILSESMSSLLGGGNNQLVTHFVVALIRKLCRIVYASTGLLIMISFANIVCNNTSIPSWINRISVLCMGGYIFQQFILKFVYYRTSLPSICSPYLLPWVGFIGTLALSILLSIILRRTQVGKLLI